jgi:Ni,Fe-hydrogenase III small subunit
VTESQVALVVPVQVRVAGSPVTVSQMLEGFEPAALRFKAKVWRVPEGRLWVRVTLLAVLLEAPVTSS